MLAIWTTRSSSPARRYTFRCMPKAHSLKSAMAMLAKATERWTSRLWKPSSPALLNSSCTKDRRLLWPRAETPTSYISMGFSPDLKEATTLAVRDMINFLVDEKHLNRDEAYMLTSVAVDVDITQLVDGNIGVHAMCPKSIFVN